LLAKRDSLLLISQILIKSLEKKRILF